MLNTARQLGAAIGVAILIATFGGALHAHMSWFADEEIEDIVDEWEIPHAEAGAVIQATLHDYAGRHRRTASSRSRASTRRSSARPPARRARASRGRSGRRRC